MIKLKRRIGSAVLAVMMLLSLMPLTALAAGDGIVYIDSNEDLVAAIKGQQNGQTWIFTKADTYDAKNTDGGSNGTYTYSSYTFAFPIWADNLTIKKAEGVGEVTITSSYEAKTANWHDQNFITVYGDGLTIDGVNIQANKNTSVKEGDTLWYDGLANKAIEFTADSSNFTLKNMKLIALENDAGQRNSGSIYISSSDVDTSSISNVEMASFISGGDYEGTLTVSNVTQDYTNFNRANATEGGSYYLCGIRPTTNGTLTVSGLTIKVDDMMNLSEQVFTERLPDGSTVQLMPGEYDVTVTRQNEPTYGSGAIIDKDNITIEAVNPADKPVIYGFSNKFSAGVGDGGINGQDTIYVSGKNVTLENLVIMPLGGIGENANNWQKTVEVVADADGFTMTGCKTRPNDKTYSGETNSMSSAAGNIHVSTNDAAISGNSFGEGTTISAGWIGSTAAEGTYSVNVSGNYWGEGVTAADIAGKIDGNVIVNTYYTDAGMTNTETIGGTPVATAHQLKNAIANAKDGDTIVLTAGTYELDANECIILNKKLTIQGTGEDTIIKGSSTTDYGNGLFTFTGGSEGSVLKDLTIEYTSTGAQCSAVYFNGGFAGGDDNNVTKIQNVNFVGGSSLESIGKEMAITSTYTKGGFIEITGCSFENFAYAMYFNAIHDLTIADNTIDGTKYNAINIAGDSEQYGCSNIVIRDNVLTNISYANYDVPEYSSGIRIGQNVSSVTLENNDITMLNGKDGIFFDEDGIAHVATFMNMGNVVQMAVSNENGEVTMPAAPSRAGYSFRGWYGNGHLYAAGDVVTITKDTTFVAQWSDNTPY